jgi:hypothetical protein
MLSLSPGDIFTKLRFLFIVVASLFGFMNLGALIAAIMDLGEKRKTLAALQSPECGFSETHGGAWTWSCEQEALESAVEAPRGSAFALSAVMGVPFVRLRAALPEEFFAGSVGQALGRRAGLSVQGLQDARDDNIAAMQQLSAAFSCCASAPKKQIPAFDAESGYDDEDEDDSLYGSVKPRPPGIVGPMRRPKSRRAPSPDEMSSASSVARSIKHAPDVEPTASRLVGTALALAFMSNAKTLSVVELARRTAAASHFFAGVTVPNTVHGFDSLLSTFLVMLSPGNLSSRGDWLSKARLWRLILLQQPDGGWRMSDSLAFALEAHAGRRPKALPKRSKLLDIIGLFTGDAEIDDVIDDALTSSDDDDDDGSGSEFDDGSGFKKLKDCPLSFSASAMRQRLPPELAAVNSRYAAAKAEAEAREREARKAAERAERDAKRLAAARAEELAATLQRVQEPMLPVPLPSGLNTLLATIAEPFRPMQRYALPAEPARPALQPRRKDVGVVPKRGGDASGTSDARLPRRVPIERIWSTSLALSVLEESDSSWLVDDDAEPERTVVDVGRAFLRLQSQQSRTVRRLVKKGVLAEHAEKARKDWKRITEAHVAQLRALDVINKFTALTHLQRASARVVRSCMTDHGTFAVFLDTAGYLARWQRFCILCTLVLSTLLTSIWFYCASHSFCTACLRVLTRPSSSRSLARRHVLPRNAQHPQLRPRGPLPRLCGRLRRLPVAVHGAAGPLAVQRRPGRADDGARLAG